MAKNKIYAFFLEKEFKSGITSSWEECKNLVQGQKARYKGFPTKSDAEKWLAEGAKYEKKEPVSLAPGIYFDAGTGRGIGVEVKVTNEIGESLLQLVVPKDKINPFGNYTAKSGSTNNFGELLGCYIALKAAEKTAVKERVSENGAAPFSTGQDSFGGFISKTEPVVFIAGYRFHWSNAK